ncbi:MAG: hypothetical protein IJ927_07020 [Eubacterium sp.]|nr:hypothetical protein [Eubacterium sp.]
MQSKKFVKLISLVLSLGFIFASLASTPALAASTKDLKDKKSKIQRQIDDAEKEIDKLAAEKKETQDYIAALDKKSSSSRMKLMFFRQRLMSFRLR